MKTYDLVIESESFSGFRSDFNNILRDTLTKMADKGILKTKMNIRLSIKMLETFGDKNKPEYNPQFAHKIKSVFQETTEAEGSFTPEDAVMEWDKDKNCYKSISRQADLFEVLDATEKAAQKEHAANEHKKHDDPVDPSTEKITVVGKTKKRASQN